MTTAEGMARMEAERVPCGVVYDPAELAADAHAQAIGLLVDDVHPIAGRIRQPRHPILFDDTPARVGGAAPGLGADTDAVLDRARPRRRHPRPARSRRRRLSRPPAPEHLGVHGVMWGSTLRCSPWVR